MDSELKEFLLSIGTGLLIGGIIVIPLVISRWMKGEKLIPKSKPTPRWTWPLGIITFGSLAAMSFLGGRPIFGSAFSLALIPYVVGQIRVMVKQKTNKPQSPIA